MIRAQSKQPILTSLLVRQLAREELDWKPLVILAISEVEEPILPIFIRFLCSVSSLVTKLCF